MYYTGGCSCQQECQRAGHLAHQPTTYLLAIALPRLHVPAKRQRKHHTCLQVFSVHTLLMSFKSSIMSISFSMYTMHGRAKYWSRKSVITIDLCPIMHQYHGLKGYQKHRPAFSFSLEAGNCSPLFFFFCQSSLEKE